MPPFSLTAAIQVVMALGLLNVWLLRSSSPTRYRGGKAQSLKEEFAEYGLPTWSFYLVGPLKLGCAALLLAGVWLPGLVLPAAGVLAALMLGAIAMHWKVKDPLVRSIPALCMFLLSTTVLGLTLT
ncbi:MAG: DoxX family protein [Planctomycetota bacterium]